jgi:hypothetical protein
VWRTGRLLALLLLWLPPACARAVVQGLEGGHVKLRGSSESERGAGLRLRWRAGGAPLGLQADYQLLALHADDPALPGDGNRWWGLTDTLSEGGSHLAVQRLDRLHLDYTGERAVLRLGRQAVSWGNGLIYNPVDFFNPFDPAAVDTEYKVGDDMLYGQYLLEGGDDWQFVSVQRRNGDGEVSGEVGSNALKFHGFGTAREYDLLVARHFDQWVLAAGGVTNLGEAVLRGDLMFSDAREGWVANLVADWSYSWVWGGHNVSAVAEYFFNGFGLRQSDYGPEELAEATDLVQRLARGELFTVGRHYLAGSLLVEITPLLQLTPNLFVNLGDGSALAQLVFSWSLAQDWQLLAALNVPVGPPGTEYGSLEEGNSLFAQLAWYF